jgi:diguanylate cyclase (GGDEF)-like protein
MLSHEFLRAPDDVAVLGSTSSLGATVASTLTGRAVHVVETADRLLAIVLARRLRNIVIDHECAEAKDALRRLSLLPARASTLVLIVARDPLGELPSGADIVVIESALGEALSLASLPSEDPPISLETLLGVSLLGGSLDQALERAADQLAVGFGVDRCVISVREDSTGGVASGTHTWSSLTWSYTAARCRAAAAAATSFAAPVPDNPHGPCETYLAVPLETGMGSNGFIGLVMSTPRRFTPALRDALQVAAARLAAEVRWRGMHDRAIEELDRHVSGPGMDPLLGIWNGTALNQLAAMQLSSAARNRLPVGALVLDVIDLQAINHRYGLEVGDRLLRRLAEAVRTIVREEDVVGRLSGDSVAVVLHGIGPDGTQRAAERLHATLAARPLEINDDESLAVPVTIGIAMWQEKERNIELLARAAQAARKAQSEGGPIKYAVTRPSHPRLSSEIQIPIVSDDIASTIGGTYRLLHEISRGGMGVVYRAQDRALERPVAIKMLRPDLAEDRELVERFRIEASTLAGVRHPNLVQIYSFGHSGGDSYFVMELVEGESLEQAIERHRAERTTMPLSDVPGVISQIAAALDALHERGIVHRDVKPANVIRDPFRNRSVLVDVGIARRYGEDARCAGTPGFVAPEVFGGGEASPRSDEYGLAATAYSMLTLTRPWGEGDFLTLVTRQVTNELQLPSTLRPELAPIDEVLVRALDPDPVKRYPSAGAFARELLEKLPIVMPRERGTNDAVRGPRKPTQLPLEAPKTRGVVFRSVSRALGLRESNLLRDRISGSEPELIDAMSNSAPLAWVPTSLLSHLIEIAPEHIGRPSLAFARDIGRATVRASFRRFFPASAATLVPETTLSAIRNVWTRYQSWGSISSMPVSSNEHVVRLSAGHNDARLCAWTCGMLEQLVVLSGAKQGTVAHTSCAAEGHDACLFRVTWERA